jgi:hypothetical protein
MASHARTLCRTLWYGEKLNVIARRLDFCYIFSKIKFKASITLFTGITRGIFWDFVYILYSTLLHLPPLRSHRVGGSMNLNPGLL